MDYLIDLQCGGPAHFTHGLSGMYSFGDSPGMMPFLCPLVSGGQWYLLAQGR